MHSGAKNTRCTGSHADNLTKFQRRQLDIIAPMTREPADSVEVDERLRRVRLGDLGDVVLSVTLGKLWGVGRSSRHPVVIQAAPDSLERLTRSL